MSIEWTFIRLGGPTHGIVTKTVHKTMPGVVGGEVGLGMGGLEMLGGPGSLE